ATGKAKEEQLQPVRGRHVVWPPPDRVGQKLQGPMTLLSDLDERLATAPGSPRVRDVPFHEFGRVGIHPPCKVQRAAQELLDRPVEGQRRDRFTEHILQPLAILLDQGFEKRGVVLIAVGRQVEVHPYLMPHGSDLPDRAGLPNVVEQRVHHDVVAGADPELLLEAGKLDRFLQAAVDVMTQEEVRLCRIQVGDLAKEARRHARAGCTNEITIVVVAEVLCPPGHLTSLLVSCSCLGGLSYCLEKGLQRGQNRRNSSCYGQNSAAASRSDGSEESGKLSPSAVTQPICRAGTPTTRA